MMASLVMIGERLRPAQRSAGLCDRLCHTLTHSLNTDKLIL